MRARVLLAAWGAWLVACGVTDPEQAPNVTVLSMTELAMLPDASWSMANALNDDGVVVGVGDPGFAALRWRPDGAATSVEVLAIGCTAVAVNRTGSIVGQCSNTLPVVWRAPGDPEVLFAAPGATGFATEVNASGVIVGAVACGLCPYTAILWIPDSAMVGLPPLAGYDGSVAEGINDAGDVVGWSSRDGANRATLWRLGETIELAGPDAGANCEAVDVNASGDVVGSCSGHGRTSAVLWQGGRIVELGTLGGSPPVSYATAINAAGHVVGWSHDEDGVQRAFVWVDGRMTPLPGPTPGEFSLAQDISDADVVVGSTRTSGTTRAVRWVLRVGS